MELDKSYNPKLVEDRIYQLWEKSGFFNPDKLPKTHKKPYSIAIPPPNVTGELHIGHALNATIQDILIRRKRMQGFKTVWVPRTDHAGIATQNVVEKKLRKEGKTRFDLGKEEFLKEVWKWKEQYGNTILDQFKKIGASCDWSRTRFTMDEKYTKAVQQAFLNYYNKGWIYRKKRVVNWCQRCFTSLSDLEIEHQEEKGKLYYIKYPLKQGGYLTVATTRPETMLGDTAVAVNPKDKRYKNLINQKVILPLTNREIPVIEDILIDPNFGTGAVKVTPAHDFTDYQISQRHNLELIQVIDEKGRIIGTAYQGMKASEAREKIIADLQSQGLIEKIEDYDLKTPRCSRCQTIIEPLPSLQWFLNMKELAKMAEKPVKEGKIKFHPKSFEKPYLLWLKNIQDWCISRQIWWGHKIPLEGEEDVLDTWFSSALWPFAIFGWPEKTKDLKTFYPTAVLSTARDIINLWVARMIFSGQEFTGKNPFSDVYIHATILTKDGKRMSKSLGTGINPLQLIEEFGADATRFGLAYQITGNQDIKFGPEPIVMGKKFCNKIWNAARFVMMQTKDSKKLSLADKKILKSLEKTVKLTNKYLDSFQFGKAAQLLYDFFWHDFCDIYIEASKKQQNKKVLLKVLSTSLKLLHPFMPFITEEIYQKLLYPPKFSKGKFGRTRKKKESLMIESWPK